MILLYTESGISVVSVERQSWCSQRLRPSINTQATLPMSGVGCTSGLSEPGTGTRLLSESRTGSRFLSSSIRNGKLFRLKVRVRVRVGGCRLSLGNSGGPDTGYRMSVGIPNICIDSLELKSDSPVNQTQTSCRCWWRPSKGAPGTFNSRAAPTPCYTPEKPTA